jgi:hypothetical protein
MSDFGVYEHPWTREKRLTGLMVCRGPVLDTNPRKPFRVKSAPATPT